MELLQLRYFYTAAKCQSITKAAQYHQIPQPAMSQTIARLEKELGNVKLFDRQNGRIYLNTNGQIFLQHVETALNALDNGVQIITEDQNKIAGHISLLVLENRRFVLSCVSKFSTVYPDVNFSVSHSYYTEQDKNYDLCISSEPHYKQMLSFRPLIKEDMIVALHESHPLASSEMLHLEELHGEKFITTSPQSAQYNITQIQCRICGFEPNVPYICDDEYFVRKYISENMGIALAPSLSWAGRFRTNTKVIPLVPPSIQTTSYIVWNENRYISPAIRKFRDFLLEQAAELDGNQLYM